MAGLGAVRAAGAPRQPSRISGQGAASLRSAALLQNIELVSAGEDFKKDTEGKPVAVHVVNPLVTPITRAGAGRGGSNSPKGVS